MWLLYYALKIPVNRSTGNSSVTRKSRVRTFSRYDATTVSLRLLKARIALSTLVISAEYP
jgi:hypothetical protein